MKRILTISLATFFHFCCFSQNSYPASGTAFLNSGNDVNLVLKDSRSGTNWNYIVWQFNDGSSDWVLGRHQTTGNFTLIRSGIGEVLTVDNTGKVGIGTTAPTTKLEIQGAGSTSVDLKVNGRIQTGDAANYGGMWVSTTSNMFMGQNNATQLGFYNNGAWRLVADNNGNVGIGTTSPNQKLTVNGTIYGKEVKVDLSVPGPDYVFEKDYELPSLEEIKNYIDQHKHLPEVPSAKEMEANGINLGEMNMILLKKVEELTLHLLEQQEQLDAQQKEIQSLKDQKK
jgi:hypothetical protein